MQRHSRKGANPLRAFVYAIIIHVAFGAMLGVSLWIQPRTIMPVEGKPVQAKAIDLATIQREKKKKAVMIHERIREVIEAYQPEAGAVEKVFMAKNPQSALVLGQARGSALLALAQSELDLSEYSALEIKRAVTGTGRATKEQVQHMIRVLLGMDRKPPQDAADALACAICHIHSSPPSSRR